MKADDNTKHENTGPLGCSGRPMRLSVPFKCRSGRYANGAVALNILSGVDTITIRSITLRETATLNH